MAEASTALSQFLEETTFECSICLEPGAELRVYPCQHYNCSSCVDTLLADSGNRGRFPCPECRELVTVPNGGLRVYRDAQRIAEAQRGLLNAIETRVASEQTANTTTEIEDNDILVEEHNRVNSLSDEVEQHTEPLDISDLIERDNQCPMECVCHRSCQLCVLKASQVTKETFGYSRWFCLPLSIFLLMEIAVPCCAAFHPEAKVQQEDSDISGLRSSARNSVLRMQSAIFPSRLRTIWSIIMLCTLLVLIAIDVAEIVVDARGNRTLGAIACGLNGILAIVWLTFLILNLTKYRPRALTEESPEEEIDESIRGRGNYFTHFTMEQLQLFVGELSLYPQICISAMMYKTEALIIFPLILCSTVLLAVFVLRLYSIVKLRQWISLFFYRLLLSCIGNYLVVVCLIVTLAIISHKEQSIIAPQVIVSLLILSTSSLNGFMFYVSHLYEVTLQSARNECAINVESRDYVLPLVQKLVEYETFHKNMYAMSVPFYGICVYFWPILSLLTLPIVTTETTNIFLLAAYIILMLVVSYKTFLLSLSAYFTCILILISFFMICIFSLVGILVTAVIFFPSRLFLYFSGRRTPKPAVPNNF